MDWLHCCRCAVAFTLVLVVAMPSAAGAPQMKDSNAARHLRQIQQQVARLPAVRKVEGARDASDPAEAGSQDVAAPAPPPREEELQLVRPNAQLEAQISQLVVSQAPVREAIASGGDALPLAGVVRMVDGQGQVAQLKALVLTGRRLIYDKASDLFSGSIHIGVADLEPAPPRQLARPIAFRVMGAEESDPAIVRISSTHDYQEVRLQVAAGSSAATVRIASELTPQGEPLDLPVRPLLFLQPATRSIEAWGLGVTDINISVIGLDRPAGRKVILSSSSGYLEPTSVALDDEGMAAVRLRSDRTGTVDVEATSPGLTRARAQVEVRLPFITALASLLGGLIGGAVRLLGKQRSGPIWPALGAAVASGVLIFAAYAIGINVLPVQPSVTAGAMLVFAISGLGAFLGTRLLDRLAPA